MRNLKKVLSLALALVMLLGMMVVGAGAATTDFADAAAVSHTTAVDIVSELNIMRGDNGRFNPEGTLTRAEAATIIVRLILGVDLADSQSANSSPFSDVESGRYYTYAVNYLYYKGAIEGNGSGNFYPNSTVTGFQFAKMLLGALDYDAETEGYNGSGWSVSVARDARAAGLDTNVLMSNQPINRDSVAQMVLNTLTANMVQYSGGMSVSGSDIDVTVNGTRNYVTNAVTNDYRTYAYDAGRDYYMQLCELNFKDLTLSTDPANLDDFGRTVSVWKVGKETVAEEPVGAIATFTGPTSEPAVAAALSKYTAMSSGYKVIDGVSTDSQSLTNANISTLTGTGVTVSVYANSGDTAVEKVVVINPYVGVVSQVATNVLTGVTTTSVRRLNGTSNTEATASASIYESAAYQVGDYVIYHVASDNQAQGGWYITDMAPAAVVTGTITSTATASGYIRLDGTQYKLMKGYGTEDNGLNLGQAVLYLDAESNVAYVGKVAAAAPEYLYVTASDSYLGSIQAAVVFPDGTKQTVNIDGAGSSAVLAGLEGGLTKNILQGKIFTYVVANDKYVLTGMFGASMSDAVITNGWTGVTGAAPFTADTATRFVDVASGQTWTGYNNVPSMSGATVTYAANTSGVAQVVYITAGAPVDDNNAFYFYVTNTAYETFAENGTMWRLYTSAFVDGVQQSVVVANSAATPIAGAGLYKVTKTASGTENYATTVEAKSLEEKTATVASNGALVVGGTRYAYDADTMFVVENNGSVSAGGVGNIIVNNGGNEGLEEVAVTYVTVVATKNEDKIATLVFIKHDMVETEVETSADSSAIQAVLDNTGVATIPSGNSETLSIDVAAGQTLTVAGTGSTTVTLNGGKVIVNSDNVSIDVSGTPTGEIVIESGKTISISTDDALKLAGTAGSSGSPITTSPDAAVSSPVKVSGDGVLQGFSSAGIGTYLEANGSSYGNLYRLFVKMDGITKGGNDTFVIQYQINGEWKDATGTAWTEKDDGEGITHTSGLVPSSALETGDYLDTFALAGDNVTAIRFVKATKDGEKYTLSTAETDIIEFSLVH